MIYQDQTRSPKDRAEDLLSRMTLREKVGQLNQRLYGFSAYEKEGQALRLTREFTEEVKYWGGLGVLYGLYRADPWSKRDFTTGLSGVEMKRAYNLAQRYVIEHSRFGVPMLTSSECPHGHQALDGYLLPVNLALGAAWNPALTERAYEVCGAQLRELGVDFALVSMLDVLRDPRWGRSEECYSEDPALSAALAKAAVTGCQKQGVAVVAKHFCAQGETTGGINASAARIGERELREIHLPPMKACCEAGVQGVMAAYNEIDGVFCHMNRRLLQTILRDELGFTGVVMADGVAIDRLNLLTGDFAASAALALDAGVEISLWDTAFSKLEEAVRRGLTTEAQIDRAALRVLELKFARGLFERPYLDECPPKVFSYQNHPESLELARQSPVLLKNNGLLPLTEIKGKKIAVIGPHADGLYHQLGDYTPPMRPGAGVTLLSALRERLGEKAVRFEPGCTVCGMDESGIAAAVRAAEESDLVVLAVGGSSSRFAGAKFDTNGAAIVEDEVQMDCGEGVDSPSLRLPGVQNELIRAVLEVQKPVAAIVVAGRPYAVPELLAGADALFYAFYPGPMGGQALAELLLGDRSPAGRLPASLPKGAGQLPCYYNYKASYSPAEPPWLLPFGYGLAYTTFACRAALLPQTASMDELSRGRSIEIRFTAENTGRMAAYAVPQLFVQEEASPHARATPRVKELKAFTKVWLEPGEARDCVLTLDGGALSRWDGQGSATLSPRRFRLLLEEGGACWASGTLSLV